LGDAVVEFFGAGNMFLAVADNFGTRSAIVAKSTGGVTKVGIGTSTPAAMFSVGSSSQFQVDTSGNVTGLSFAGSGSGLTSLTPANISAGTAGINITGTAANIAGGVNGSLPYQTASGTTTMLPIGSAAQVLTVVSGVPSWQPSAGGGGALSWTTYTVPYTSFNTASTTQSVTLFTLGAGIMVHAVVIYPTVSFTGGGITAYTLSVGPVGSLTKYASPFDVFQAVGGGISQASNCLFVESFTGSSVIDVTATSTSANVNAATAGSATIYVLTSTI
jgi:hypothetical protein